MILRLLRTEPAVLRGLLVAITAIAAAILGRAVDTAWIDTTVTIYAMVSGLIASILIRPKVVSVAKLDDLGIQLPAIQLGKHYREGA